MNTYRSIDSFLKDELRKKEFYESILNKTSHGYINHGEKCDYYRLDEETRFTYANKESKTILSSIKLNRFAELGLRITNSNLLLLGELTKKYRESGDIISTMAKSYRPSEKDFANLNIMPLYQPLYTKSESTKMTEELKHLTLSGVRVRSKNEVFIADALFREQIPFSYEKALPLFSKTLNRVINVYPDFTISSHGETKYWEHFGRMDDSAYAENFKNKIITYYENGIISEKNLIITMDGPKGEFDTKLITEIVCRLK